MNNYKLIGPFAQLIPMAGISLKGAVPDDDLIIFRDAGILIDNDQILKIGQFDKLEKESKYLKPVIEELEYPMTGIPGIIDAHTHICFAGSRAKDYALRNSGSSYLEIGAKGGGIWDTVGKTRAASQEELVKGICQRADKHLKRGITTIEVKSGYGLSVSEELKMLRAIRQADALIPADLIGTCLAAHIFPKDFTGTIHEYLNQIVESVFPVMKSENLGHRVDAFIENGAYDPSNISSYLKAAQSMNFDITIHADQFHTGGSEVAVNYNAISADHLEASGDREIKILAGSKVVATALPGASLGLGVPFAPARKILDAGGILAIASDWNPGSAPMGDLMTAASILGTFEKLSNAEVFAGITLRAAAALNLTDRGILQQGFAADIAAFPTGDYKEILYHQGQLQPIGVWKNGIRHY